jgi:cobalamin biosynthesis Co2+ chelatase CbiK
MEYFKEFEEAMEKGEILCLGDIKAYAGKFTGKFVKLVDDYKNDFDKFKTGDIVLVFNLDDYKKFQKGIDLLTQHS